MKHLFARIAKIIGAIRGNTRLEEAEVVPIDAYCADCGGMVLIRAESTGRVYCPQCHRR